MAAPLSLKQLLETGVHFGHRTQKWNPKMEPFIFTQRNGIHIIDLQQTLVNLHAYYDMVRDLAADGGTLLFVGTKRQAQETIAREAERCGMPYVNHRWLGGTLTNWRTIRERIDTLKQLEARRDKGEFELLTKREALGLTRKIDKLQMRLGGIREMKRLPDMLLVVDTQREETAVKEANILAIPVLALVDTNSDPDYIDYIVPANDDAMRAIKLLVKVFADAVLEGKAMRKMEDEEDIEDFYEDEERFMAYDYDEDEEEDDERYLGQSTLAKLRSARLEEDEDEEEDEVEEVEDEDIDEEAEEEDDEDEDVVDEVDDEDETEDEDDTDDTEEDEEDEDD